MKKSSRVIVLCSLAAALQGAGAADISGTVTLKGTAPKEQDLTPLMADPTCGKLHSSTATTHHYVVGPKGEFANVVVSLVGVSGKSTGASATPVTLDQKGCEYVPSIFAVQTDQKILAKNSDPVAHNVHPMPAVAGNKEENRMQPPNAPDLVFTYTKPEPFLRIKCDVHPWMFAWVTVLDHPYFAVSDKDGNFKITNVPPGKYTIQAVHRKAQAVAKTQEVEVKEGATAKVDFVFEPK